MNARNEEINAMNLRVLQRDPALRKTDKIVKTVKFAVLARYDEDSKHWNYLKVKGPMFLVVDTFGTHRIVILNHYSVDNEVVPIMKENDMKFELIKLEQGEGYMLNYLINDSIAKRSIFGIWTADESIVEIEKEIQNILKS